MLERLSEDEAAAAAAATERVSCARRSARCAKRVTAVHENRHTTRPSPKCRRYDVQSHAASSSHAHTPTAHASSPKNKNVRSDAFACQS